MMNNDEIKTGLKQRMDKFFVDFRNLGLYPYELYTLMHCVADEYGIEYNMDLHQELIMGV